MGRNTGKAQSSGDRLVAAVLKEMRADGLVPDARELAMLEAARELRDRMTRLQDLVATDGERATSESGIVRLHPAIAEHRQAAVALTKVLSAVVIAETSGTTPKKDPTKQRAANARWDRARRQEAADG